MRHVSIDLRISDGSCWFVVACEECEWWDDESDNLQEAEEIAQGHLDTFHAS